MTSINVASVEGDSDARYLRRAVDLARRALGGVGPRAPVGAVIVAPGPAGAAGGKINEGGEGQGSDDEIVGEGATQALPGDHAEVVALKQAGVRARGATLYCTLEPHAHQGSVPPCTDAIIREGVRRVVCALRDPNPKVNGAGFRKLREAGIEVSTDVPADIAVEAAEVIEGFATRLLTGRPFVIAKYAMTLDGKIATRTGASRWITGEAARVRAHALRAAADAVVVGIGTVLADDPRLTARVPWAEGLEGPRPRFRVVVDSRGRMPASAAMLQEPGQILHVVATEAAGEAIAATARGHILATQGNVETISLPRRPTGGGAVIGRATAREGGGSVAADGGADGGAHDAVDLPGLLDELGRRGVTTVLVEGGAHLLGGFFDARLVDKVVTFVAPKLFGGDAAPSAVAGVGIEAPDQATMLERVRVEQLGEDFMISGYVVKKA